MGVKQGNAFALLALTTGAGVVVGTNIDLGGVYIGSVASTVTVIANGSTAMQVTANVDFYPPIALQGPVTMTSSGGSFYAAYRNR